MRKITLIFFLLAWGDRPVAAEIIDRIAAVVGRQAIAQSEVDREARLERYFKKLPPARSSGWQSSDDTEILERLIQQRLIQQEMEQTTFPPASQAEVRKWLSEMQPDNPDPSSYGLSKDDLLEYAQRQVDIERFIELRFRPGLQVTPEQIETYYRKTLIPELEHRGAADRPALEKARGRIEQILVEEHATRLLEQWLSEARALAGVRIVEVENP